MTPLEHAEWLEKICADMREQGADLLQVLLDSEGVGPARSVVDELELLAASLRIALDKEPDGRENRIISRIVVERFLTPKGQDLVEVRTDEVTGDDLPVVEALGLLQLAIFDVSNRPAGDDA